MDHYASCRRAALCALALAVTAPAQVEWERSKHVPPVTGPLVHDSARDRYVVLASANGVGSPETWEWDRGLGWLRQTPTTAAPSAAGHSLAYDSVRGVTVLFHSVGQQFSATGETWTWDGVDWTNTNAAVQPPARSGHAMAFDSASGRVVLFGGMSIGPFGALLADTWEWDGTTWTQQLGGGPPARSGHGMVFDPARGEVVLFGGSTFGGVAGDAWAYSGGVWSALPGGPPPRTEPALGFDVGRSRAVLFGGMAQGGGVLDDTWEWNGTAWMPVPSTPRPSPRQGPGAASDPVGGGVLLVGGRDAAGAIADVWRWDGTSWTPIEEVAQPAPRHSHAAAFDEARGEMLVFGGVGNVIFGDLWRWDGAAWSRSTVLGPSPRLRAVMAYDAARAEAVLFGGELPGFTDQTWTWDGSAWMQHFPAAAPSARVLHAMAYDRDRDRVVLFGGTDGALLADTWEWDGAAWQQLSPGPTPQPRHGHAMAYDDGRGVTVLYGGTGAGFPFGTILSDTWEWNGSGWSQRTTPNGPGPRREFAMAYDRSRDRVVLFGDQANQDTWEWDGTDWLLRATAEAPPPRTRTSLVYDTVSERSLLFGGQSIGPNHLDVWSYRPVAPAQVEPFGSPCPGSAGPPAFTAAARPWLGDVVPLVLGNGPAMAPAVFWAGLSTTAFGALPLPAPLASIGLPGCTLWTGLEAVVFAVADASGVATVPLAVPNVPALLGAEVHAQGAFFDPPANAFGFAVAAAVTLRVGGR